MIIPSAKASKVIIINSIKYLFSAFTDMTLSSININDIMKNFAKKNGYLLELAKID
jgi:hypothetical protein